ncbi:MAG: glycosyltransferase family 1 protein [Gemmatimonadales bacterium]|nr:glycosyltransferase family 1 protein [Gemmatimonadales bacterium]
MPMPIRPLRVLYCTDTYPPQVNGVSVVTALSAQGLSARGWRVGVIGPTYPTRQENPFGTEYLDVLDMHVTVSSTALPMYPEIRLAAPSWRKVRRAVSEFRPDLIHCATEFMIGRLGQRAAVEFHIPIVSSYHTDFSRYTVSYGVPWLKKPVAGYLTRFHGRSRRVYTPGSPARAELEAMGIRDVEVWGRGVDTDVFHPRHRSEVLRQAYGADTAFLFLHVGRLAAEKGIERLIEAFGLARQALGTRREIHLVIAGAGPREPALRQSAPPGVSFLGNLDRRTMLPQLYASADAFLFSSHTETLGLVILEAMASELPVIAAPAGGVADHLRDGVNGIAYPPGDVRAMADAMVALATDPDRRAALADGARATAAALTWEMEFDRLDASYREVCVGTGSELPELAEAGRV